MRTLFYLASIVFIHTALASFNLDTLSPTWSYTSAQLAVTTSAECKGAYRSIIKCDETLLELATSTSHSFDTSDADLARTCTTSCKDSLSDFVTNLGAMCNGKSDIAIQQFGGGRMLADRVFAVGNNLEYVYAQSCSKDSSGHYCRMTPNKPPPASCSSSCSVQFFSNINQFMPASFKRYNSQHQFSNHSDTWKQEFNSSYEKIEACGKSGAGTNSLFPGFSTLPRDAQGLIASATGDGADLGGYVPLATATGSGTTSLAPASTSPSTSVTTFKSTASRFGSRSVAVMFPWIVGATLFAFLA